MFSTSCVHPYGTSCAKRECALMWCVGRLRVCHHQEEGQPAKVVEGSDFVVSRVANIDNSSKYMVDGKTKTRAEVEELLMSKGIDLENNRFLILQGEVEQIATMKPKGMTEHDTGLLEYLEEVIGSNCYAEPIADKGKLVSCLYRVALPLRPACG